MRAFTEATTKTSSIIAEFTVEEAKMIQDVLIEYCEKKENKRKKKIQNLLKEIDHKFEIY